MYFSSSVGGAAVVVVAPNRPAIPSMVMTAHNYDGDDKHDSGDGGDADDNKYYVNGGIYKS